MGDSGLDDYRFSVTRYAGLEGEVLRLRNANRQTAQAADYLNWRYSATASALEPKVFWVNSRTGRAVGMAALIFRRFWIDNEIQDVAVLGDISLDSEVRGQGLGKSLLRFVAEDLDRRHPECLAFVIPNDAAQRSLTSAGWTTGGSLTPFVLALNPEAALRRFVKSSVLAKGMGWSARKILARLARMNVKPGYSLSIEGEIDDSFETLWQRYDKKNVALSDRGIAALEWRYANHPQHTFKFAKLKHLERLAGFLVYRLSEEQQECLIYDVVLPQHEDLGCMLALFVMQLADRGGIDLVRLLLNSDHRYRKQLWKLGFVARNPSGVFQLYGRTAQNRLRGCSWFLTYGDKDI